MVTYTKKELISKLVGLYISILTSLPKWETRPKTPAPLHFGNPKTQNRMESITSHSPTRYTQKGMMHNARQHNQSKGLSHREYQEQHQHNVRYKFFYREYSEKIMYIRFIIICLSNT